MSTVKAGAVEPLTVFVKAAADEQPLTGSTNMRVEVRRANAPNVNYHLGAATAIVAYMQHESTGMRRTLSVTISDPPAGEVTITWVTGDTATPGRYRLWIVLTFPGGPETFPSCTDGNDAVYVEICPG